MRRLLSIRVQQTALFVLVVVVALALLATWIYGALSSEVATTVRGQQIKDANAVAEVLGPDFPLSAEKLGQLRDQVKQFGDIFDDDVRVYDLKGGLIESRSSLPIPAAVLAEATTKPLQGHSEYANVDFRRDGLAVAAVPIYDRDGGQVGVVVVANRATDAMTMLDTARSQLEIATLATLLLAGILGFIFSDFIARQARRLVAAANVVASGDFSQRLPRGPFPGEIRELVEAFNRMAGQLGEAFETLRGQEQAQREFVANASHELRTPIAALKGAVEILENGGKDRPEVRDEFLPMMRVEANRLQRLVDNLFTLAQVDAGRLHLQLRPADAEEIVWVVSTAMRPLANDAGVAIQTKLPAEPLEVLADRDYITQVLLGFVDNAVKHSKPGDIVTISAEAREDRVHFAVSDTGPGIPPDVLPHIFDRFFTQRKSAEGQRRGSGLGLAIAAEILESHASHIDVSSELGEGATFSFDLPRAEEFTQP